MTTEEHLNKIIAKCRELLAGAEKRTQYFIKGLKHDKARDLMNEEDIEFGLSCAGPAEAGWRATIAAIEGLLPIASFSEGKIVTRGFDEPCAASGARIALQSIIAAWPEELL